ncbi:MAG: hypothetical protein RBJ76_13110 [Stenomitos frigidus ULC029]
MTLGQLSLVDTELFQPTDGFDQDAWETPTWLAREFAGLVKPTEKRILEPAAGSGMVAQFLPLGTVCVEIKEDRVFEGTIRAPQCHWHRQGFFSFEAEAPFDLVISNFPFSTAMLFIEKSLQLLDVTNPEARILALLPTNFFQTQKVAKAFKTLGAHVHHKYEIVGRVAFLKQGVEKQGRQCDDAIFDLRRGTDGDAISYLWRQ